jgi:hypothetical protein
MPNAMFYDTCVLNFDANTSNDLLYVQRTGGHERMLTLGTSKSTTFSPFFFRTLELRPWCLALSIHFLEIPMLIIVVDQFIVENGRRMWQIKYGFLQVAFVTRDLHLRRAKTGWG